MHPNFELIANNILASVLEMAVFGGLLWLWTSHVKRRGERIALNAIPPFPKEADKIGIGPDLPIFTYTSLGPAQIAAGSTHTVHATPQRIFKIAGAAYHGPPNSFDIGSIIIGQTISTPTNCQIPAEALSPAHRPSTAADYYHPDEYYYIPLDLPVVAVGQLISLQVTNKTAGSLEFSLTLFGWME